MIKQILVTAFFITHLISAFGQEMTKAQKKIVTDFIDCIKNDNKKRLFSKVAYPLTRQYPLPSIKNKQAFLKRYGEVFDAELTDRIIQSNPTKDWSAVGWRGIMLLNGDLWLDEEGRLIAVNYESEAEAKNRNELIKTEKSQLHPSLRDFQYPIHILETSKYRIRIDGMGDDSYRYASWKIKSKMSDKPEIVLLNGEKIVEGSGGNHSFVFVNDGYKYDCAIIAIGEADAPPAYLTIYKGDKEILSQKAAIVVK